MANNTYTLSDLQKAVTHALGGAPDTNLTATEIVNGAINWISSFVPWRWKCKTSFLTSVSGQTYLALPADFEEVVDLVKVGDTTGSTEHVTFDRISRARQAGSTTLASVLFWDLNFLPQTSVTNEATAVLEVYPTPASSVTNFASLNYRRQIPKLSASTDMPDVPSQFHEMLKVAVRAYAVYQETQRYEADWSMLQTMLPQYQRLDGRASGVVLGRYQGGNPAPGSPLPPTITAT